MQSQQINVVIQDDLANLHFPKQASGSFAGVEATINEMDEIFELTRDWTRLHLTSSNISNCFEWSTRYSNLKVAATRGDSSLPKR
jgi:hypothetical protein